MTLTDRPDPPTTTYKARFTPTSVPIGPHTPARPEPLAHSSYSHVRGSHWQGKAILERYYRQARVDLASLALSYSPVSATQQ